MHTLTHFRLCPHSRSIRLAMAEIGLELEFLEERPWEHRPAFLVLNPSGELPVLALDGGPVLCGAYAISEYFGDLLRDHVKHGVPAPLYPGTLEERAEIRRLVDWFHGKLHREATRELLTERVYGFLNAGSGHVPEPDILRAVRANLRYHLHYLCHLADNRRWLGGDEMSFADIAAASHLSTLDYLGEVPWQDYPVAKSWYARMKSRPSFRAILADRIPGAPPSQAYADLDF